MRARLAWALFALTALVAVGHLVLLVAADRPVLSTGVIGDGFPLVDLGAVAGALVGAVIVSRYPGHRIGWLFVVGQFLSELGIVLGTFGHSAVSGELGDVPGGHLAIWLSIQFGGLFVVAMLAVLFLLSPDGHLASPRWRWALALPVCGLGLGASAVATVRPGELDRNGDVPGGVGPVLETAMVVAFLLVAAGVLAGLGSLAVRLRRARGDQRHQLRWIVLAAGGLALGVVANLVSVVAGAPEWLQPLPLMAAYACIPVLTGVAILRYRLYEIDVFLDRAITLTVLTGFVTLGYVAVVVVLGELFPLTHGELWPSLLATTVVALAFQPVRRWAERLADRVVYGARAAPYVELAEFSRGLAEAPRVEDLLERVCEAVAQAVGAREVAIRVNVPGRQMSPARWPERPRVSPGRSVVLPVRDGDEELAEMSVTMPPGAQLRPDEERLLADFAVQLGRAFRNLRLESDLLDRVAELEAGTAALAASARRLDLARDAERRRFETSLARSVLPHLAEVRDGLGQLVAEPAGAGDPVDPVERLEELVCCTQEALEGLRTLTRGVFPTQLVRSGLVPALRTHVEPTRAGVLEADARASGRFDPAIESAVYFCAVEFLREVDAPAEVRLRVEDDRLVLRIEAPGAAPPPEATEHLHDRAATLDGTLAITDHDGRTSLRLVLPATSEPHVLPHPAEPVGVELGLRDVAARPAP